MPTDTEPLKLRWIILMMCAPSFVFFYRYIRTSSQYWIPFEPFRSCLKLKWEDERKHIGLAEQLS